jgi:putative hemolysin
VPVFFAGQNSRLFQVASHVSMTLRLSLVFKEVYDRIGTDMPVRVGTLIPYEVLKPMKDRKALMQLLRDKTYDLAKEIAPHHRRGKRAKRGRAHKVPK